MDKDYMTLSEYASKAKLRGKTSTIAQKEYLALKREQMQSYDERKRDYKKSK